MPSVYVVCWLFLQSFQTYFCIQANSVDPGQTDLVPHCLQKWLLKSQADDKAENNIVVMGSFWLCWGLTTRQPLRVILCRLPEKGRKEIEERE